MKVDDIMENAPADPDHKSGDRGKASASNRRNSRRPVPERTAKKKTCSDQRLSAVRRNVKNGLYKRPSLVNSIVEKMIGRKALERAGCNEEIPEGSSEEPASEPDIRRDRVEQAKKGISCDKYSDSTIVKAIAERILEKLGIY